jgi:outer membrane protein OmpA-like peptidoglycan-associated protein
MSKKKSRIFILVATLFIISCGGNNLVVLVPDPDGNVGSITISNQAGSVGIYAPNQVATIKDKDTAPSLPVEIEKKEIDSLFSEALAIQPSPPIHFRLYFERDSIELKPDSAIILSNIVTTIQRREPADVSVVGHTDTLGEKIYNMKLSQRRALAIRDLLIERGIKAEHITTSYHGEDDLLIKTKDNVSNPKNRRAEVVVR